MEKQIFSHGLIILRIVVYNEFMEEIDLVQVM